jgi:hypothetical protein
MISINIHSIKAVRARLSHNRGTTWVDLKFFNEHGKSEEVCVFFDDPIFAKCLTDAINALNIKVETTEDDEKLDAALDDALNDRLDQWRDESHDA